MALFTNWTNRLWTAFNSQTDVQPVAILLKNADDTSSVLGSNGSGALKTSGASSAATLGSVVTVAATKAQFASMACQTGVLIQADLANTGICSIGNSTLTTSNGIQLQAGDSAFVPVSNVNLLYSIGTVLTDKLRVLAL